MVEQTHALHTSEIAWKSIGITVSWDVSKVESPSKVEADFFSWRWNTQTCIKQGKHDKIVNLHLYTTACISHMLCNLDHDNYSCESHVNAIKPLLIH